MMKLSQWARKNNISYPTALQMFRRGEIPNSRQLQSGTILIEEDINSKKIAQQEERIEYLKELNKSLQNTIIKTIDIIIGQEDDRSELEKLRDLKKSIESQKLENPKKPKEDDEKEDEERLYTDEEVNKIVEKRLAEQKLKFQKQREAINSTFENIADVSSVSKGFK